jgi:hypothetical protein
MNKNYVIHWTKEADETYIDTLSFILEKWTIKEALNFEKLTEELLMNLSHNLKLCPELKSLKLHKCVVSEQTSMIYKIVSKSIEIVTFIDNRSKHHF